MEWRTTEVRWFRHGPCPDDVVRWFHGAATVSEPESRTDEYARLGRDDLGVKRRGGGQLDLKVRSAQCDDVGLPAGLVGRVEQWVKWSFALDPAGSSSPSAWLPVEKTRWTRRYEVVNGQTTPIAPTHLVPAGCAAELAVLRVGPVEAWSIGFEAFDTAGDGLEPLTAGVGALLAETPIGPIVFEARHSCGYPEWLTQFE